MPTSEHLQESLWKQHKKITMALKGNSTDTLRACLHERGRPQVGEVTTLAVVAKKSPRLSAILQPWDLGVRLLVRLQ